ncbi:zinc finger protein Xfin-like [Episyrphus balteatus]|uniref:zinc finger protein Xfin-like n=1 Tax=Episyrphus balteatus TaxID=286459 RepID=UPI0024859B27|nr:zinc finger protein Xfin-like [Episyrphus balteatus]
METTTNDDNNLEPLAKLIATNSVPELTYICRICLCEANDGSKKISSKMRIFSKTQEIRFLIQESTGVDIIDQEFLPNFICEKCLKTLTAWCELRFQAKRSDEILTNYLLNLSNTLDSNPLPNTNFVIHLKGDKISLVPSETIDQIEGFEISVLKEKSQIVGFVFHCASCTMSFTNQLDLDKHAEEHSRYRKKAKFYKCELCNKMFTFQRGLDFHKKRNHSADRKKNQCGECGRDFITPKVLQRHQNLICVPKELIEKCRIAPMNVDLEEITAVCEKAMMETKFSCVLCKEIFYENHLLNKYFSSQNFKNHNAFVQHFSTHNDNLRCSICHKDLLNVTLLERHVRVHLREKVYTCPICSRSFYRRNTMQEHVVNHVKSLEAYRCNECRKEFFTLKEFKKHIQKHFLAADKARKASRRNDRLNIDKVEKDDINEFDSNSLNKDESMMNATTLEKPLEEEKQSEGETSNIAEVHKPLKVEMHLPPIELFDSNEHFQIIKTERESPNPMESDIPTHFEHSNEIQGIEKPKLDVSSEEENVDDDAESDDDYLTTLSKSNTQVSEFDSEKHDEALLDLCKVKCHIPGCQQEFSSFQNTVVHFSEKHLSKQAPFECEMCFQKFHSKLSIKLHIKDYYTFKCPVCSKMQPNFSSLNKHIKGYHLTNRFKCSHCDKTFGIQNALKCHELTHKGTKEFKCDLCEKEFYSKNGLYLHQKSHKFIKELQCLSCGIQLASKSRLARHVNKCVHKKRWKRD